MTVEELTLQYEKARKKGLRVIGQYKASGRNSELPVLDSILSRQNILSEVSLGYLEIPIKKVIGTKTQGRSSSFSPNYMPILDKETEFANKWMHLYKAHMTEGIRDPVKVYEYMNWYYVEEGNKRVSVLKYSEAALVPATVTRMIPKYDKDDPTIVMYYEFLDFYKKMPVNFIWFSELGCFDRLYKIVEKYGWQLEKNQGELSKNYYNFRKNYFKIGGDALPVTTGDAFLKYLEIHPMDDDVAENIQEDVKNIYEELSVIDEEDMVELALDDTSLEKRSLFSGFPGLRKKMNIAFVHAKNQGDSAWTYAHELGRMHLENTLGDSVSTVCFNDIPEDDRAYDAIAKIAEQNFDVIFATSPAFIHQTLKASMKYEQVKFLNCSENLSYRHLRTYFGRIYEPNFLVGMIAGAMTKTNQLGYVVTYPIPEVISSINAFTLGAQFMNPYVEVFVKWVSDTATSADECLQIDRQLVEMGSDIICHQESADLKTSLNHSGIYFANDLGEDKVTMSLAVPIWHWGTFYEKIVSGIVSGNYNRINGFMGSEQRAISYWWGMDTGVVDVMYSRSKLPSHLIKSVEFMKSMILEGRAHPFTGPIYDQKGNLRVEKDDHIGNEGILTMDWFVDGVIGSIPTIDAMKEDHKLLDLFSVKKKYR